MLNRGTLSTCTLLLIACVITIHGPLSLAVGDEPKETNGTKTLDVARLRGYVRDPSDAPIDGAIVRIVTPDRDMRFSAKDVQDDQMVKQKRAFIQEREFEVTTNDDGEYTIEISGINKPTVASIDVMKPGFQRLSGTLMRGGDARKTRLIPRGIAREAFTLQPARYFCGTVVDEQGAPVPNVAVSAGMRIGRGAGGVERTVTNEKGEFELFNYPLEPDGQGGVSFSHPSYLSYEIPDIYKLKEDKCRTIRIVMDKGRTVRGALIDADGKPAGNVMVEVADSTGMGRKAVMTDTNGKFLLEGVRKGKLVVKSLDYQRNQKATRVFEAGDKLGDLELHMEKLELPDNIETHLVMGMKLADITPEIMDAYDYRSDQRIAILDPGPDSERLQIGKLKKGFHFWMVGQQKVGSVREFVEAIIAESETQDGPAYSIRVVYTFYALKYNGNNTQYLSLKKKDIDNLRTVLKSISDK